MQRFDDQDDEARRTRGLAALALVLALALVGSYLIAALRQQSLIEDCLLAHRSNCDALLEGGR